jgi:four helix bundle protein
MGKESNLILDLSLQFAIEISIFCDELDTLKKYRLSGQLFGSGTSIGAQVHEAQNAESRRDFIHKIKIALKESEETRFWLKLCELSPVLPSNPKLAVMNNQIMKILGSILSSANRGNPG